MKAFYSLSGAIARNCRTASARLPLAINDTSLRQIVRRQFNPHPIPRNDTNEVLAHPPRNVSHHEVSTFDFNAEPRIRQGLGHNTLDLKSFFLLFRHTKI